MLSAAEPASVPQPFRNRAWNSGQPNQLSRKYAILEKHRRSHSTREGFAALQKSCLGKDGHKVLLETSGVPFCYVDGNFQGYRGIGRDITDREKQDSRNG
jgi:PAS domain-containing protein